MILEKRLNILVFTLFLSLLIFVVHDRAPVDRFDSCLKGILDLLFQYFFILKEVAEKQIVLFGHKSVGFFDFFFVFLNKVNLSPQFHVMRLLFLVPPQVINKIVLHFLLFVVPDIFFAVMFRVIGNSIAIDGLVGTKIWILNSIQLY